MNNEDSAVKLIEINKKLMQERDDYKLRCEKIINRLKNKKNVMGLTIEENEILDTLQGCGKDE